MGHTALLRRGALRSGDERRGFTDEAAEESGFAGALGAWWVGERVGEPAAYQ